MPCKRRITAAPITTSDQTHTHTHTRIYSIDGGAKNLWTDINSSSRGQQRDKNMLQRSFERRQRPRCPTAPNFPGNSSGTRSIRWSISSRSELKRPARQVQMTRSSDRVRWRDGKINVALLGRIASSNGWAKSTAQEALRPFTTAEDSFERKQHITEAANQSVTVTTQRHGRLKNVELHANKCDADDGCPRETQAAMRKWITAKHPCTYAWRRAVPL